MGREGKDFSTFDMQLAAYLEMKGLTPGFSHDGNRIMFHFPASEQLYRSMAAFNADAEVPIITYLNTLRSLKNRVFALRAQR